MGIKCRFLRKCRNRKKKKKGKQCSIYKQKTGKFLPFLKRTLMCVTIASMKGLQYVSWLQGNHELWKIYNIISPICSSFPIVSTILWEIELLDFGKQKTEIYFCYIDLWKTVSQHYFISGKTKFILRCKGKMKQKAHAGRCKKQKYCQFSVTFWIYEPSFQCIRGSSDH